VPDLTPDAPEACKGLSLLNLSKKQDTAELFYRLPGHVTKEASAKVDNRDFVSGTPKVIPSGLAF
jgi:hypothetical protein